MRARLACVAAIAVLLAACGTSGVTPGAEHLATSAIETPSEAQGTPHAAETWPGPTAEVPSRMPTTAPGATSAPSVAPTPRVTPEPTLPPVTPRWVYEGIALNDPDAFPDAEHWYRVANLLLANGDVLLVNGGGREVAIRDAGSGAWRTVPGLPAVRTGFGFVALGDGSALAVGGVNDHGVSFSSVYRFDPVATTWQKIGLLEWARSYPGVALLPDGRVLVAGGSFLNGERADASSVVLAAYPEDNPAGIELADIDVPEPVTVPYATVEIFDPATGTSRMARPMACARGEPGVATLADGRILVTDRVEHGCGAAEIYDPATGSFTKTGELPPLDTKALERLGVDPSADASDYFQYESLDGPFAMGDGGALLGFSQDQKHGDSLHRSFRFRPATNSWAQFGPMAAITWEGKCTNSYSLRSATLVPLAGGRVFVVGGSIPCDKEEGGWDPVLTTRIFDPVRNDWLVGADLPGEMTVSAALQLPDGSVLLAGRFGEDWYERPITAIRYVFDSSN
jgi:hypothetical protein